MLDPVETGSVVDPPVLLVSRSTTLHPGAGGMEQVTAELVSRLARSRMVTVVTTSIPGMPQTFDWQGASFVTVPGSKPGRYSMTWWIKTWLLARKKRRCVLLSESAGGTAMILGARRSFERVVIHAHGTARRELSAQLQIRGRGNLWALKALRFAGWMLVDCAVYTSADAVLCASETVREALDEMPYRFIWRRTTKLATPNGVDTHAFKYSSDARHAVRRELEVDEHQHVAIAVGRVVVQKGFDRCLAAAAANKSSMFWIVGDGPDKIALESAIASLKLTNVRLLPRASPTELAALLSAADVFAFTSRAPSREALPLVVLEALASGLPVVAPLSSRWPKDLEHLITLTDVFDAARFASDIASSNGLARQNVLPPNYDINHLARVVQTALSP